jgi:hypothetical protein
MGKVRISFLMGFKERNCCACEFGLREENVEQKERTRAREDRERETATWQDLLHLFPRW